VGRSLDSCCGLVHRDLAAARLAEQMMRARYTAFALGRGDVVISSWHPDTRPAEVNLDPTLRWQGLEVLDVKAGGPGDQEGVVEFRASYTAGDTGHLLQERSRFRRVNGVWYYLDGVHR
jgi:SEC-C motif-containing protein